MAEERPFSPLKAQNTTRSGQSYGSKTQFSSYIMPMSLKLEEMSPEILALPIANPDSTEIETINPITQMKNYC